ncbi:hypothetical protein [Salarchaeum sp. JOR-1]|uniref:hypothetical protein n=1 Tax=Salarchaeum sp. JOR-1 TaxID=2599399 RepID=UPI001198B2B7|nr:hypothetical protein [Salarchaeum sp. JOR-1]QDX40411.1 hypothetical protein FQU85_05665 [Salarchaeum sp. JOR-1]
MNRAAAVWGLVGALAFLVLAQAYRLATGDGPGLPVLLGVALAVFLATALTVPAVAARMRRV